MYELFYIFINEKYVYIFYNEYFVILTSIVRKKSSLYLFF